MGPPCGSLVQRRARLAPPSCPGLSGASTGPRRAVRRTGRPRGRRVDPPHKAGDDGGFWGCGRACCRRGLPLHRPRPVFPPSPSGLTGGPIRRPSATPRGGVDAPIKSEHEGGLWGRRAALVFSGVPVLHHRHAPACPGHPPGRTGARAGPGDRPAAEWIPRTRRGMTALCRGDAGEGFPGCRLPLVYPPRPGSPRRRVSRTTVALRLDRRAHPAAKRDAARRRGCSDQVGA
jgi:hypothetical protein